MQKCKKCNCDVFKALVSVPAALTITETGKPEIKQYFEDNISIEKLMCANCETEYPMSEFESKQCKRCNNVFLPNELNEDGFCAVCEAIETRFKDVSIDDMVRKSLDLEKELADIKNQMLELSRLVKENQLETKKTTKKQKNTEAKKTTKKASNKDKKEKVNSIDENKKSNNQEVTQLPLKNKVTEQSEEVLEEVAINKAEQSETNLNPAWTESIKDSDNGEWIVDNTLVVGQKTNLKSMFNNSVSNDITLDFSDEYDDNEPF